MDEPNIFEEDKELILDYLDSIIESIKDTQRKVRDLHV